MEIGQAESGAGAKMARFNILHVQRVTLEPSRTLSNVGANSPVRGAAGLEIMPVWAQALLAHFHVV